MNSCNKILLPEKSKIFPILKNLPYTFKTEYSLNNSFFDPCHNSPPNDFMAKLEKRLNSYNLGMKLNNDNSVYLTK